MADIVDAAMRSRMMSGIRGEWTRPERVVARLLRELGVPFRTHAKDLPGNPDFVLPDHHVAIRVHGCFWHLHDCPAARMPATRREFWEQKLLANRERDEATNIALVQARWRVLTIWECALRGRGKWDDADLAVILAGWLTCDELCDEVSGRA